MSNNNAKIISFVVRKGGSGKTTSALNVGFYLARMNKKVLLIDLDPQADLTGMCGLKSENLEQDNIFTCLKNKQLSYYKINEYLSILPSYEDLDDAEQFFASALARESLLKNLLKNIKQDFDYIIIDCPPSTGFLTRNALVTSDFVFIPVQSQVLAYKGLVKVIAKVNDVRDALNHELKIGGVFLTMLDKRDGINTQIKELSEKTHPTLIMETHIRKNVALTELPLVSQDIYSYNPNSNGAEDYLNLTKEIIKRINNLNS